MKQSRQLQALRESIDRLQVERARNLILLRDQFHVAYESLKPINLIKHTFKEASASMEVKDGMLNNVIGLTTGYVSRAIFVGSSANPIRKMMGAMLQFTVATLMARNAGSIKSIGRVVLEKLFKKPAEAEPERLRPRP